MKAAAISTAFYPKATDPRTGREYSFRVVVRKLFLSWGAGDGERRFRVTQTRRGGADRYTLETMVRPGRGVPWASAPEPYWARFGATLSREEFHAFLTANRLPAADLIFKLDCA